MIYEIWGFQSIIKVDRLDVGNNLQDGERNVVPRAQPENWETTHCRHSSTA